MAPWSSHGRTRKFRRLRCRLVCYFFTLVLFVYIVIPFTVWMYPGILHTFVFQTGGKPSQLNLNNPEDKYKLPAKNFYLHLKDGSKLGIWHVFPAGLTKEEMKAIPGDNFSSGHSIILYLHGQGGTRGGKNRVETCRKLSEAGYHVVTFDFRGYADSYGDVTEDGFALDAYTMYKWTRERSPDVPILIWGHSLGSSIAARVGEQLCKEEEGTPTGLVLEGAFNNLQEMAYHHPLSWPYRSMPWIMKIYQNGLKEINVSFATDKFITGVQCPILMLHALDDPVVPYTQAEKLYQTALQAKRRVQLKLFPAEKGYGHLLLYQDPDLPKILKAFEESSRQKTI